jgi:hypothetical protein
MTPPVAMRAGAKPSVAELKARVAMAEQDLRRSIDDVGLIVEDALDWKKKVREHPLETAALVAVVGFLAMRQPGLVTGLVRQVGKVGLGSLVQAGGGPLVGSLLARFTGRK